MTFNPDTTMTEFEFKRPLLDPNEERLARELQRDSRACSALVADRVAFLLAPRIAAGRE
jgi:hypothetical protein